MSRFLRRAAPSLLLLRSRSLCASAPPPLFTAPLFSSTSSPSSSSPSSWGSSAPRRLSSLAASDASLLRVVEAEIKCAEECDDHDRLEAAPEGFPFQIEDKQGTNVVRLSRTYQGKELIEVTVSMPSLVTGDHNEEEEEEEDPEEQGQSQSQPHIPLVVRVSKENKGAPTLEFACTAYPDEVVIDSMSVIEGEDGKEEVLAYEGPEFNDLDENLQKALHKYLELRGITPLNTNFLHEYMINKDSREYLLWLRNLKAFLLK